MKAKIDTYLEVKHCEKWDAKVVAKMDEILNANLDANMVLLRMQIWLTMMSFKKQKNTLTRKTNKTLFRKQTSTLPRKKSWMLFWKQNK